MDRFVAVPVAPVSGVFDHARDELTATTLPLGPELPHPDVALTLEEQLEAMLLRDPRAQAEFDALWEHPAVRGADPAPPSPKIYTESMEMEALAALARNGNQPAPPGVDGPTDFGFMFGPFFAGGFGRWAPAVPGPVVWTPVADDDPMVRASSAERWRLWCERRHFEQIVAADTAAHGDVDARASPYGTRHVDSNEDLLSTQDFRSAQTTRMDQVYLNDLNLIQLARARAARPARPARRAGARPARRARARPTRPGKFHGVMAGGKFCKRGCLCRKQHALFVKRVEWKSHSDKRKLHLANIEQMQREGTRPTVQSLFCTRCFSVAGVSCVCRP